MKLRDLLYFLLPIALVIQIFKAWDNITPFSLIMLFVILLNNTMVFLDKSNNKYLRIAMTIAAICISILIIRYVYIVELN